MCQLRSIRSRESGDPGALERFSHAVLDTRLRGYERGKSSAMHGLLLAEIGLTHLLIRADHLRRASPGESGTALPQHDGETADSIA